MNRINQIRVSHGVRFFKEPMMNRWNMVEYTDPNDPCLFFNINNQEDIDAVKQHKGFKLIFFANARGNQFINNFIGIDNLAVINANNGYLNIPNKIKSKKVMLELQDYSMFKPNPLGDKIYCYVCSDVRKSKYGYEMAQEIQKKIKWNIIFGMHPNSIEFIKENYYDNCFINLNLEETGGGGMNTVFELGRMGRKSICNSKHNYPSFIKYNTIDDIVNTIKEESKKIGTIQPSINFHEDIDWQDLKYWK